MRTCRTCLVDKQLNEFHLISGYYNSECKICHNLRVKNNTIKKRLNLEGKLKDRKKCKLYRERKGKEYMRSLYKKSYYKNIDKRCADRLKRRALGNITEQQIKYIKNLYNEICVYCNKNKYSHIDHFISIKNGGTNDLDNLVTACINCNLSKAAKYPLNFIWELVNKG